MVVDHIDQWHDLGRADAFEGAARVRQKIGNMAWRNRFPQFDAKQYLIGFVRRNTMAADTSLYGAKCLG